MAKYVRKGHELRAPALREVVEATQWFQNGDHPEDDCPRIADQSGNHNSMVFGEGHVVRYYRHPRDDGKRRCLQCGAQMHHHGWIDELPGGLVVCVCDYVVTDGVLHYPMRPKLFEALYEPLPEHPG